LSEINSLPQPHPFSLYHQLKFHPKHPFNFMKTLVLSIAVMFVFVLNTFAQKDEKYVQAMQVALTEFRTAETQPALQNLANRFEMIAKNTPSEWLPVYYASFMYAQLSYTTEDSKQRDVYVEKAEKLIEQIMNKNNDEIYVMRAFVAQASLSVNGAGRWMKQGGIFDENMEKAEKLNPKNPRIEYLRGTKTFYTPRFFGGGARNAKTHFDNAKPLFESFKSADELLINWGKDRNEAMLKKCEKELQ
jgi:hypothetical protein